MIEVVKTNLFIDRTMVGAHELHDVMEDIGRLEGWSVVITKDENNMSVGTVIRSKKPDFYMSDQVIDELMSLHNLFVKGTLETVDEEHDHVQYRISDSGVEVDESRPVSFTWTHVDTILPTSYIMGYEPLIKWKCCKCGDPAERLYALTKDRRLPTLKQKLKAGTGMCAACLAEELTKGCYTIVRAGKKLEPYGTSVKKKCEYTASEGE